MFVFVVVVVVVWLVEVLFFFFFSFDSVKLDLMRREPLPDLSPMVNRAGIVFINRPKGKVEFEGLRAAKGWWALAD